MRRIVIVSVLGLLLFATGAMAQSLAGRQTTPNQIEEPTPNESAGGKPAGTADWSTPAQETICDNLIGQAFGICNAYCEALDCHLDNPNASATACTKLFDKFVQVTGVVPPCEITCPCTELPFFSDILDGTSPATECFIVDVFGTATEVDVISLEGTAAAITGEPTPRCGEFPDFEIPTILEITLPQAQQCNQLLIDTATNQGVICQNVSI